MSQCRSCTRLPLTPPALDRLVRQCLAKSPDDRWDTAHDVVAELKWIRGSEATAPAGKRTPVWQRAVWLGTGVVVGVIAALLGRHSRARERHLPSRPSSVRHSTCNRRTGLLSVHPMVTAGGPSAARVPRSPGRPMATPWCLSVARATPRSCMCGRSIAIRRNHWRAPTARTRRPCRPTANGSHFGQMEPSRRCHSQVGQDRCWNRISDYVPTRLTWSASNDLFYDSPTGIRQARAAGGRNLTRREENGPSHTLASLLPGDRVVLYTVRQRQWTWGDEQIVALRDGDGPDEGPGARCGGCAVRAEWTSPLSAPRHAVCGAF